MTTLTIKDLARNSALDSQAMADITGGCGSCYGGWKMPAFPGKPVHASPSFSSTTDIAVSQSNQQYQNNPTGNGSAVFGGGIYAYNNQQGFNSVGV